MNLFKKAYCRLFQTAMRAALPFMPYRQPALIDGLSSVPGVLRQHSVSCVLLTTDRTVRGLGLTAALEEDLRLHNIRCVVYDKVVPNPTTNNVEEALCLYRQHGCQALIGFGGGSSMDCAKAVGARVARPNRSLGQMEGILNVHKKIPLLIAVPTTSGTGSETTLAAIITDPIHHRKYPINDFPLMPAYNVLDPALTVTLPPDVTASTGMDAMTHAVEAFIGRSTNAMTREASIRAVRLILEHLPRAYSDGGDLSARAGMQQAAYWAGAAFTRSYVGYVHAVAHTLGGQYSVPHGLANSVLLPLVLEQYGVHAHHRLALLARAVGVSDSPDDRTAAEAFITRIRGMNDAMGIPRTLSCIREEDIPQMVRNADREGNPLYPVPVLWGPEELERIYHLVQEDQQHDRARDPKHSHKAA